MSVLTNAFTSLLIIVLISTLTSIHLSTTGVLINVLTYTYQYPYVYSRVYLQVFLGEISISSTLQQVIVLRSRPTDLQELQLVCVRPLNGNACNLQLYFIKL